MTDLVRPIMATAAGAGSTAKRMVDSSRGKHPLVIHDPRGRALVVDVVELDGTAGIGVDLRGFDGDMWHAVMTR